MELCHFQALPLLIMWSVTIALLSTVVSGAPLRVSAGGAVSVTRTNITTSSGDAMLDSEPGKTNVNYGGSSIINVWSEASKNKRMVVKFDQVPGGATVSSMTLSVKVKSPPSPARTYEAQPLSETWVESNKTGGVCTSDNTGVTWDSRDCTAGNNWTNAGGTVTGSAVTATTPANPETFMDWSFSSSFSYPGAGFRIKDQTEDGPGPKTEFYTKEDAAANHPKLTTITFTAPWDSYNNSARTTQDDTFGEGETTVFMRGTGYILAGSYVVGYYDGNGDKRCTEVVAASGGTLDSSCAFRGAAALGTWHAVVFQPGITAPATYSAINQNTHNVVGDDTFTVQQGAVVPEIPSVVAGLLVGAATVMTFWWFARAGSRKMKEV